HSGNDRPDRRSRRTAQGSELREFDPAPVRAQRAALAQLRVPGAGRHLYAPGVLAQAALQRGRAVSQLAGRLLLSVPRLALRPRRPGVLGLPRLDESRGDRKSTRLNSSHVKISYAVFCLKKKNKY